MRITNKLEARFLENIKKYSLIDSKDTIIVGTSGGPDSVALVYLLAKIRDSYKLNIVLAHLNHLHRKEAELDEKLVADLANNMGFDFRIKHASMDDYAKKQKISPEDAGRRLRYEFFDEIAKNFESPKIATAHIKDDQAETVLMRMIRGTGAEGLAAMDFKNRNIIRPLLNFEKSELLAYLHENNINYATDQTNFESDYTRNYIRNEIFPKMEEINPNVIDSFYKLSQLVRDDIEIIDSLIEEIFASLATIKPDKSISYDRESFENQTNPIKAKLIRQGIFKIKGEVKDISKDNIDKFISLSKLDTGKEIIKDDLIFIKNYEDYRLEAIKENKSTDEVVDLLANDQVNFLSATIKASLVEKKAEKNKNIAYFDYDKLSFPLKIRSRRNGDSFYPLGLGHRKKLKDFFIDEKVDRNLRDQIPLVLSNDQIIWISGFRQSEDYQVDSKTKKILKIEVTYEL